MKPAQQMRVVIQLVGGTQHLLIVTAMIARRSFFLRALTDDVQLLPAQLDDFGQYLFQIHRFPFPATWPAMCAVKQTTDMNGRTTPHDIRRTVNGHPHGAAADPANSGRSAASHPTFIHDQRQQRLPVASGCMGRTSSAAR
jgi:hypothetical protein